MIHGNALSAGNPCVTKKDNDIACYLRISEKHPDSVTGKKTITIACFFLK